MSIGNETKTEIIGMAKVIADQQQQIKKLTFDLEVQKLANKQYFSVIDKWEDFYSEARNLDPSLEDIAERHKVETTFL